MPDVREQIRNSRPDPEVLEIPDLDAFMRRAQRRRTATRTVGTIAALVVVAAGVAAVQAARPNTTVYLDAGTGGSAAPSDEGAPTPRSGSADATSLDAAIDRLVAANRQAPPRPVPGDPGEVLIQRTYAIWGSASVRGDETTHALEVVWYENRTDHLGDTEIVREGLGEVEPTGDLAALRRQAAPLIDRGLPEAVETMEGSSSGVHAEQALQEAELDAQGSSEPAPGSTERPDQAHAFMRAADALRVGLQPQDRIRALGVIRELDPSLVEYRGAVKDLLGREGIGIAGRDGDGWGAPRWDVLIFDPETGDLMGEYSEFTDGAEVGAPPVTGYSALETELVDTNR